MRQVKVMQSSGSSIGKMSPREVTRANIPTSSVASSMESSASKNTGTFQYNLASRPIQRDY